MELKLTVGSTRGAALAMATFTALTVVFVLGNGSGFAVLVLSLFLMIMAVCTPSAALGTFLIPLPYEVVPAGPLQATLYAYLTPALIGGYALRLTILRRTFKAPAAETVLLSGCVCILSLSSYLFSLSPAGSARSVTLFAGIVAWFVMALHIVRDYSDSVKWLFRGAALGAVLVLVLALASHSGVGRLAFSEDIGGGVRRVSNALALGLAGVIYCYMVSIDRGNALPAAPFRSRLVAMGLGALLLVGVVLTVSRGVFLAVLVLWCALLVIAARRRAKKAGNFAFGTLLLVLVLLVGSTHINDLTGDVLAARASATVHDVHGVDTRVTNWKLGLTQLEGLQLVIGAGARNFRLVTEGRHYEHSVFVSAVFSGGIIVLLLLIGLLVQLLLRAQAANRLWAVWPLVVYTLLLFATHGNLTSRFFWSFVLICWAVAAAPLAQRGGVGNQREILGRPLVGPF